MTHLKSLLDVKGARLIIPVFSVIVINAIGYMRVLLYFKQSDTGADGVDNSGRQIEYLSPSYGYNQRAFFGPFII